MAVKLKEQPLQQSSRMLSLRTWHQPHNTHAHCITLPTSAHAFLAVFVGNDKANNVSLKLLNSLSLFLSFPPWIGKPCSAYPLTLFSVELAAICCNVVGVHFLS
jgi:hypothetical protein